MTHTQQMHAALKQADAGMREFIVLYAEQLPPDRMAKLDDWMQKGLRIGLHLVTGAPAPVIEVTLVDHTGGLQVIERLDFRPKH